MDAQKKNTSRLKLMVRKSIHFFYKKFIKPKSIEDDDKRKEFVLNIFLLCSIILYGIGLMISLYQSITISSFRGISPLILFFFFLALLFLYILSRTGFFTVSSYIFIGLFFLITTFATYKWSIELPSALLFYTLTIIMSGVLINTCFTFLITGIMACSVAVIGYLQINQIIIPELIWKQETLGINELITYIVILVIIAIVAWLSNREMEKALKRARISESALKKERDLLEIKVKERTQELQKAQTEKINSVYRLAEIGHLSSGLFHDLVNPLTALSLNIEKMQTNKEVEKDLERTIKATEKIKEFVSSVRKQIAHQQNRKMFSLNQEIKEAIEILNPIAHKKNVKINFYTDKELQIFADPIKFNQIAVNLISNAIASYDPLKENEKQKVNINLKKQNEMIVIRVKDYGKGILKGNQNKIFKPFFTTKNIEENMGMGLSLIKHIVESDFNGKIDFKSNENQGTTFIIKFKTNNYD